VLVSAYSKKNKKNNQLPVDTPHTVPQNFLYKNTKIFYLGSNPAAERLTFFTAG
jgi:hypothetical protein